MDFSLSPDQELLRDTGRAVAREHCPPSLVRAYADDAAAADDLTRRLSEFAGLVTGPVVDLCLFLEELGAALVPGPFVPTVATFAPVLSAIGATDRFDQVAAGETTGTVACPAPLVLQAPAADRVDQVAVVGDDGHVHLADDVEATPLDPFDLSRPTFDVRLSGPNPPSRDASWGWVARATVALSAEVIGTTRWLLHTTLDYVKTREQFGRPIGSFQALQHRLADMDLLYERAWSSVYWAAMAVDADDPEQHRAVHIAKVSACEAARHIGMEAMQMHGGIGFTWEHDLHLFLRRALAAEDVLGTTAWHRDRLATLVLD